MRLFALRLLSTGGSLSPGMLQREWKKLWRGTERSLPESPASRRAFGQITNAYKTCRWLFDNGFCVKEDARFECYLLSEASSEKAAEVLRCQELLTKRKLGVDLSPFEEETLKLIQQKHETATR